jgi:hypothetical protein
MVSNVGRSWHQIGHQLPIKQQWELLRERVGRTLPHNHKDLTVLQLPCDIWAVEAMQKALSDYEQERAQRIDKSPEVRTASQEYYSLMHRYATALGELRQAQRNIRTKIKSTYHQILDDIPIAWDQEFQEVSLHANDLPQFSSVQEARRACGDALPSVMLVEQRRDQLHAALAFHNYPMDQKALALVEGLYENHVKNLTAHIAALADRLGDLELKLAKQKAKPKRKPKPKPSYRGRSSTSQVGASA